MPLIEIAASNTRARIRSRDKHVYEAVDEALSFFSKVAPYQHAYKLYLRDRDKARKEGRVPRGWNGMVHLFDKKDSSFPAGLLPRMLDLLSDDEPEVYDSREPPAPHPALAGAIFRHELVDEREWQEEAFQAALRNSRGVFEAATGAGKTTLIARLVAHFGQPTLLLVNRITLARQTLDTLRRLIHFPNADDPFGLIGGGQWWPGLITVATYETLSKQLEGAPQETIAWLSQFKAVHIDESHHVAARTFYALTHETDECYYRYGYSATPFKNDRETELRLVGICGEVIYRYTPAEAMADGIISKAKVYVVDGKFKHLKADDEDGKYPGTFADEYKEGIVEHRRRNVLLANIANACAEQRVPTLALFRQKKQGKTLEMLIEASYYLDGHSSTAERERAKKRLGKGKLPVLLASTIFNEGEDVPAIGAMIIAGGYRAEHLALQQLGRGLRPSPGKKFVLAFDSYDGHSLRLERHSKSRIKAWREAGFEVHVVTVAELEKLMAAPEFWG